MNQNDIEFLFKKLNRINKITKFAKNEIFFMNNDWESEQNKEMCRSNFEFNIKEIEDMLVEIKERFKKITNE